MELYHRQRKYKQNKYVCFYCGNLFNEDKGSDLPTSITTDHIIPFAKNGINYKKNKVKCCKRCNEIKGSLWVGRFLKIGYLTKKRIKKIKRKLIKMGINVT